MGSCFDVGCSAGGRFDTTFLHTRGALTLQCHTAPHPALLHHLILPLYRCEAVAQHWVNDCPTQGDPAYDRKRVRPPVGIPMTRLMRSEEGGLVLPGGQTGTLMANEDAFARDVLEVMGLGAQQQPAAAQQQQQAQQEQPLLLLDSKPAAEGAAAAVKQEPGMAAAAPAHAAAPAAAALAAAAPTAAPLLAGEAELAGAAPGTTMPAAGFFAMVMQTALMPRGPPDFLRTTFDRQEPLPRAGGCLWLGVGELVCLQLAPWGRI